MDPEVHQGGRSRCLVDDRLNVPNELGFEIQVGQRTALLGTFRGGGVFCDRYTALRACLHLQAEAGLDFAATTWAPDERTPVIDPPETQWRRYDATARSLTACATATLYPPRAAAESH